MADRTCAERLPEHLQGRLDELRMLSAVASEQATDGQLADFTANGYWNEADGLDIAAMAETAREVLNDYGLSVERRTVLRWTISTGGPADGFDVTYDDEGDAVRASYWFQDWFDGAEQPVDQDTMELVSDIVNPDGMMLDVYSER